jgi:uncharacterized membrane protein
VSFAEVIEVVVRVIEATAVAILAVGVLWGLARAVVERLRGSPSDEVVAATRLGLGRVLLLGLEVLIAADIISTVALDLNLESVVALGLIVLIRTFLSWAIEVESYGHWPWQTSARRGALAPGAGDGGDP